jgi:hypothetical protein
MNSPGCCPSEFVIAPMHCSSKLFNDDDDRIDDQYQDELPNVTHWTCKLFNVLIERVWKWELHALLKRTMHTSTNATQNMGIS